MIKSQVFVIPHCCLVSWKLDWKDLLLGAVHLAVDFAVVIFVFFFQNYIFLAMDQPDEPSNRWELSKENILPLKQGRKATVLSVALDENAAQKLNTVRQ